MKAEGDENAAEIDRNDAENSAKQARRRGKEGSRKLEAMLVARLKSLESEMAESRAVIEGLKSSEVGCCVV